MNVKRRLQTLLLAGEIEPVLRTLTVLADQQGDNRLMNEVVHLTRRYQNVRPGNRARQVEEIRQALGLLVGHL